MTTSSVSTYHRLPNIMFWFFFCTISSDSKAMFFVLCLAVSLGLFLMLKLFHAQQKELIKKHSGLKLVEIVVLNYWESQCSQWPIGHHCFSISLSVFISCFSFGPLLLFKSGTNIHSFIHSFNILNYLEGYKVN